MIILPESDPEYDNIPEYVIAEIRKSNYTVLIAVGYRQPGASSAIEFFETLSNFTPNYQHIIITEDSNANCLNPNPKFYETLLTLMLFPLPQHSLPIIYFISTHYHIPL